MPNRLRISVVGTDGVFTSPPYGWLYNRLRMDAVAITLRDAPENSPLGTDNPQALVDAIERLIGPRVATINPRGSRRLQGGALPTSNERSYRPIHAEARAARPPRKCIHLLLRQFSEPMQPLSRFAASLTSWPPRKVPRFESA